MNTPKRYEPSSHYSASDGMAERPAGRYVRWEDYVRLKDRSDWLESKFDKQANVLMSAISRDIRVSILVAAGDVLCKRAEQSAYYASDYHPIAEWKKARENL
jgi:hypothetical protein